MLCATTRFKYSTLGAKYLRVIKHAIQLSPIQNFRVHEDVIILEPICKAIRGIITIMQFKLAGSDRNPLS